MSKFCKIGYTIGSLRLSRGTVFSIERHNIMIKHEKQGVVSLWISKISSIKGVLNFRSRPTRRNLSHVAIRPVRQGVSPQVLEMLDRTMEEYKEDLEYLKDR